MRNSANKLGDDDAINISKKIDLQVLFENASFKQIRSNMASGNIPRKFPNLLSIEEESIVRFYTTEERYTNFNAALRGELPMTDFFATQEYYLNSALSKLPKTGNGKIIYRGTGKPEIDFYRGLKEGDDFTAKDFMSFSTDEEEALSFYYRRQKQTGEAAIVSIKSNKGVPIYEISELWAEAEILYNSKAQFKFVKMYDGIIDFNTFERGLIIELEEL